MIETISLAILIAAGLIVVSILTSLISFRVGAPLLLVFLCVGLLAGEDGIGGLEFENVETGYFICSVALAIILFDSGLGTRIQIFRVSAMPAVVLATAGVLLTAGIFAVPARYVLDLSWLEAILLGSIVGSTDAAAVSFLLRTGGVQIRERIRALLEIESGSNDPMAIFLALTLVEAIGAGATGLDDLSWDFVAAFVTEMGLGLSLGMVGGYLIVQAMRWIRLEQALYPIIVLGLAMCLFALTSMLHGSGFIAVYVAGLLVGNADVAGRNSLRRFHEGFTWLAQITMFLVLGLLANPSEFPAIAGQAVLVGLALIFIARPIAVWLCLLPFNFSRNETTFLAWVGLRGAVSILLGILPIIGGMGSSQTLFNVTFIVVLTSLLIQGWTVRPMARWLGLIVPPRIGQVDKVELELPGAARHELVVYHVSAGSPVVQGERIPRWARPSLVVRDGRSMRIHEAGRPQPGDYVYIFTVPRMSPLLDRLFASPRALTEADMDYFGEFAIEPTKPIGDVARNYGFEVAPADAALSVGDYLKKHLGGAAGRGERLILPPVELIVRDVNDDFSDLSVGLAVTPSPSATPKLPVFQNAAEIAGTIRARLQRRAGGHRPAEDEGDGAAVPEPTSRES